MNNINRYSGFVFEKLVKQISESIVTDTKSLLKSIDAKEIDIFYELEINPETFVDNATIEQIYDNVDFNKSLDKKKFRKSPIEETKDIETFLEKTIDLKYFFIYKKDQSELETPQYIVLQSKDKKEDFWENVKGYKVKGDINNFFSKLTTKTIEIKRGDKTYIYNTSNSGNDWVLQNIDLKNDEFKEFITNDEIKKILQNKDTSINII